MEVNDVVVIMREFLWTGLWMVAPSVVTSLVVGLIISIFQTVTSIQEQTLSFAPRIVAVCVVIGLTLTWTLSLIVTFTNRMLTQMPGVGG